MRENMKRFFLIFALLVISACAKNVPQLDYNPGAVVESLSAAASLSVYTGESGMSGRGYIVYRRPDKLHLIVLSPFGTTVFEAFALGERVAMLYPSQSVAYVGTVNELPEQGGLHGWRMMHWIMEADPAVNPDFSGTVTRDSKSGFKEQVVFENGLITSKTSPSGDTVYYKRYSVINGVPVASELDLRNDRNDRIRIVLDAPEVNTDIEDAAFIPRLEGMTILPLSALKQM
jgi:hypothetical protein